MLALSQPFRDRPQYKGAIALILRQYNGMALFTRSSLIWTTYTLAYLRADQSSPSTQELRVPRGEGGGNIHMLARVCTASWNFSTYLLSN